jgi:copper chaperone
MDASTPTPFSLQIDGMHCGGCVRRVRAALTQLDGVTVEDVEVGRARGTVAPGSASPDALRAAIEALGFQVQADASDAAGA